MTRTRSVDMLSSSPPRSQSGRSSTVRRRERTEIDIPPSTEGKSVPSEQIRVRPRSQPSTRLPSPLESDAQAVPELQPTSSTQMAAPSAQPAPPVQPAPSAQPAPPAQPISQPIQSHLPAPPSNQGTTPAPRVEPPRVRPSPFLKGTRRDGNWL